MLSAQARPRLAEPLLPAGVKQAYLVAAVACGGSILAATLDALHTGGRVSPALQVTLAAVVQVAAGLLCLARAGRDRGDRAAWRWLGGGMLIWTLGSGVMLGAMWVLGRNPQEPTAADPFFLAFYPCAYTGVILLMRRRSQSFLSASWLDGLVAGLGLSAVAAAGLLGPLLRVQGGRVLAAAVTLAYPVGDLILLCLVATMAALARGSGARRWWFLITGCLSFIAADVAFLFDSGHGA